MITLTAEPPAAATVRVRTGFVTGTRLATSTGALRS